MRVNTPEADEILYKYFPVLDHGFVALCDYMGNDQCIEDAARVSYGNGTRAVSDTETLIRYLRRHLHTTPSEMVELKFHFGMPIFVARQFFRHRTFSYNEYSGRYSEVPDVYYTPDIERITKQAKNNKQGSSDEMIYDEEGYKKYSWLSKACNDGAFLNYKSRLNNEWAKELARIDLPLSTYTYFYCKMNLHNLFHFLKLRCDSHAQYEIRVFADVMAGMAKRVCPLAFNAWVDYNYTSKSFSRLDILFLNELTKYFDFAKSKVGFDHVKEGYEKALLDADNNESHGLLPLHERIGMSKRELTEFWLKLNPMPVPNFDLDLSTAKTAEEMK